jgi:hypothetical protein
VQLQADVKIEKTVTYFHDKMVGQAQGKQSIGQFLAIGQTIILF